MNPDVDFRDPGTQVFITDLIERPRRISGYRFDAIFEIRQVSSVALLTTRDHQVPIGNLRPIQKIYRLITKAKGVLQPPRKHMLDSTIAGIQSNATKEAVVTVERMPVKDVE